MKKNQINTSLIIGAFLVIIFGFMLFTFQVREGEVAIKTRFGKAVLYDDLYVEGDTLPDGKAVGDVKTKKLTLAPVCTYACPGLCTMYTYSTNESRALSGPSSRPVRAMPNQSSSRCSSRGESATRATVFRQTFSGDQAKADAVLRGQGAQRPKCRDRRVRFQRTW